MPEAHELDELKASEERKRTAAYDPARRWRHLQETIAWVEANLPPAQRRNRPRTRLQDRVNSTNP
jgi:hypothetical protein